MVKKKDPKKYGCTMGCGRYGTAEEFHDIKVFGKTRYVCPDCAKKAWGLGYGTKPAKDPLWGDIPKEARQELPWKP